MIPISKFRGFLYKKIQIQFKTGRPSQWKQSLRLLVWIVRRDFALLAGDLEKLSQECASMEVRLTGTGTRTNIAIQQWDRVRDEVCQLRSEVAHLSSGSADSQRQIEDLKRQTELLRTAIAELQDQEGQSKC